MKDMLNHRNSPRTEKASISITVLLILGLLSAFRVLYELYGTSLRHYRKSMDQHCRGAGHTFKHESCLCEAVDPNPSPEEPMLCTLCFHCSKALLELD